MQSFSYIEYYIFNSISVQRLLHCWRQMLNFSRRRCNAVRCNMQGKKIWIMHWALFWPFTIAFDIFWFRILIMLFSNKLISKPNDKFAWQNNQQFFHEIQIPQNSYPTVMSREKYIDTNFSIKSTLSPLLNQNEPCLFTMSSTHCTAFYVYCC